MCWEGSGWCDVATILFLSKIETLLLKPRHFFQKPRHFFQKPGHLTFSISFSPSTFYVKKKKKGASLNQPYSASVIFEATLLPSLLFIYLYAVEYERKTGTLWFSWEINRDRGQKTGTVIAKQRRLVPSRHWQHHPPSDCLSIKYGVTNK